MNSTGSLAPSAKTAVQLAVERGQALLLVMDRDDDADHEDSEPRLPEEDSPRLRTSKPGNEDRGGRQLGGHPDQPQHQRRDDRPIRARARGPSADISTPSRTPSPPGSTATTKPATVASATLAITTGARPRAIRVCRAGRVERAHHRELAQAQQDPAADDQSSP